MCGGSREHQPPALISFQPQHLSPPPFPPSLALPHHIRVAIQPAVGHWASQHRDSNMQAAGKHMRVWTVSLACPLGKHQHSSAKEGERERETETERERERERWLWGGGGSTARSHSRGSSVRQPQPPTPQTTAYAVLTVCQ